MVASIAHRFVDHVSFAALPVALSVAYALLWRSGRWVPLVLFAVGSTIGATSTFIGAGADALVLPALLYTALFTPREAVATSMAVFLLPVQALTVVRAYRAGDLAINRAVVIAISFIAGNWVTADHFDVNGRVVRYSTAATLLFTAIAVIFAPESFSPYDNVTDDSEPGDVPMDVFV